MAEAMGVAGAANPRENARERILVSAGQLVAREGVKELTIENVAAAAGISRGGVLYHFPSKEALIQGMMARFLAGFEQFLDSATRGDAEAQGAWARAFVEASFGSGTTDPEFDAAFTPLIAAIAYDPRLLDPLRDHLRTWKRKIADGLDPTVAAVVRLAAYAMWLDGLFHFHEMDAYERRRVRDYLMSMVSSEP